MSLFAAFSRVSASSDPQENSFSLFERIRSSTDATPVSITITYSLHILSKDNLEIDVISLLSLTRNFPSAFRDAVGF